MLRAAAAGRGRSAAGNTDRPQTGAGGGAVGGAGAEGRGLRPGAERERGRGSAGPRARGRTHRRGREVGGATGWGQGGHLCLKDPSVGPVPSPSARAAPPLVDTPIRCSATRAPQKPSLLDASTKVTPSSPSLHAKAVSTQTPQDPATLPQTSLVLTKSRAGGSLQPPAVLRPEPHPTLATLIALLWPGRVPDWGVGGSGVASPGQRPAKLLLHPVPPGLWDGKSKRVP